MNEDPKFEEKLVRSAAQGVIVNVHGDFIERIARRAAELQGMPADKWPTLDRELRRSFERGTSHVLRAMQSLGWKFVPPGQ